MKQSERVEWLKRSGYAEESCKWPGVVRLVRVRGEQYCVAHVYASGSYLLGVGRVGDVECIEEAYDLAHG